MGRGFIPVDEESRKLHRSLVPGEILLFRPLRVRSLRWHRMYYGICTEIGQNQDPVRDKSSIDMELRMRAGHKELVGLLGDQELWVPKRIAFDKMSPEEWAALWPSLELAIREHFGEGYITEWTR